jgi:tripartite-type tricarboxylate transporter receptor subunit TctC
MVLRPPQALACQQEGQHCRLFKNFAVYDPLVGHSINFVLRTANDPSEGTMLKLPHRRKFLHLAAGAVALPAMSRVARAQAYPTRPVRIIVGFAAGGPNDILARLIGQQLSERLGQPFIIENRPGASGNIGTEAVVRAAPDGYTFLLTGASDAISASLYEKLNFNFIRDIAPVASLVKVPLVLEVTPSVPAKSVLEFISYAKANPGKINMASSGNGTSLHVAGELFKMLTGVNMVHVPYRGAAPAITDLIGGQVQVMFGPISNSIEHIRAGKLRALAVTTATRAEALPDIPTVGDFVPGYEASTWFGVGAPRNTPAEIIDKLNREINAALADADLKARIADLGSVPIPMSPSDFGKFKCALARLSQTSAPLRHSSAHCSMLNRLPIFESAECRSSSSGLELRTQSSRRSSSRTLISSPNLLPRAKSSSESRSSLRF